MVAIHVLFVVLIRILPCIFVFCNFDNEETPRAVGLSPYKGMITGAYDVLFRKNPKLTEIMQREENVQEKCTRKCTCI